MSVLEPITQILRNLRRPRLQRTAHSTTQCFFSVGFTVTLYQKLCSYYVPHLYDEITDIILSSLDYSIAQTAQVECRAKARFMFFKQILILSLQTRYFLSRKIHGTYEW